MSSNGDIENAAPIDDTGAPAHRIALDIDSAAAVEVGAEVLVEGDEASHAVGAKRLAVGEAVELIDGRGLRAAGEAVRVGRGRRASLTVRVTATAREEAITPRVVIAAAIPKTGVEQMVDQLGQAGVAAWIPTIYERSATRELRRPDRLTRAAMETAKQCGRAWHLEIADPMPIRELIASVVGPLFVAEGGGVKAPEVTEDCTAIVGPEGGLTMNERAMITKAGGVGVRLGPHVLRIETAAVLMGGALLANAGTNLKRPNLKQQGAV